MREADLDPKLIGDGDTWFLAIETAEVLGFDAPREALEEHTIFARKVMDHEVEELGVDPSAMILPDRDLYSLVLQSPDPGARHICEWLLTEVMPSVLKDGKYPDDISRSAG